jgi:thioredoxin-like negative regulator of GroEL
MAVRRGWLGIWLVCLGCQSLPPLEKEDQGGASQHWELGQAAMRQGRTEEAIRHYEQSLAADPNFTRNHLSLAAAYLQQNNADSACAHLARYVDANPDQLLIRARYAELLLRLGQLPEARTQFEALVCDSQSHRGPAALDLIHCHGRLMEIAEESTDVYNEHLHRGIGLFLLARKRGTLPDEDEGLPAESLLFKAAAELTLAQLERPDEARPYWYLYEVWSRLGQRQPALCRLRQADAAAPFSFLTPAERCALQLAYQRDLVEVRRK